MKARVFAFVTVGVVVSVLILLNASPDSHAPLRANNMHCPPTRCVKRADETYKSASPRPTEVGPPTLHQERQRYRDGTRSDEHMRVFDKEYALPNRADTVCLSGSSLRPGQYAHRDIVCYNSELGPRSQQRTY